MTPEQRFLARTDKTDDCWLWQGALDPKGYGRILDRLISWNQIPVHRWAYLHYVGPIAEGLTVDHRCRVTNCVRPDHLRLLTASENVADGWTARDTCQNGHPRTPETTVERTLAGGRRTRMCIECERARRRRYYHSVHHPA